MIQNKITSRLVIFFIILGLITRLHQFFYNKSLWLDEASLALNIVERDCSQLLQSLDHNQMAPIGFLVISKWIGNLTEYADWGLRIYPLLCSIVSLFLFRKLLRQLFPNADDSFTVLCCTVLFACSFRLMYYAAEFKQYGNDVFWALLAFVTSLQKELLEKPRQLAVAMCVGIAGVWFSHSLIFILGGIGTYRLAEVVRSKKHWLPLLAMGSVWLISFTVEYWLILSKDNNRSFMQQYWQGSFLPILPSNRTDFEIWLSVPEELFYYTLGISSMNWLLMFVAISGAVALWYQQKYRTVALMLPFLLVLTASALKLYPYNSRLLLFLTPSVAIITGTGATALMSRLRQPTAMAALLGVLIFSQPIALGFLYIFRPMEREEVKTLLQHYRNHAGANDVLYVYYGAAPALKYYHKTHFRELPGKIIYGKAVRNQIKETISADVEQIRTEQPHRLWLLFSHVFGKEDAEIRQSISVGWKEKQCFSVTGASLCLFE